jgi:sensor histidine kinase regulating citrate/malate metabolism
VVLIVVVIEENFPSVSSFIQQLEVAFHHFDLQRCDEKTLYVTIFLKYRGQKVLCDFIYIINHQEMFGAISINEHYKHARNFIQQHFHHILLYSDELRLAQNFMNTFHFKQSLQQFAKKYPKFMTHKQLFS